MINQAWNEFTKKKYEEGHIILTLTKKVNGKKIEFSVALTDSMDYNLTLGHLTEGFYNSLKKRGMIKEEETYYGYLHSSSTHDS